MTDLTFCALVKFPVAEYFSFNTSMNGLATVDSITRDDDEIYNATIEFAAADILKCMTAVENVSGIVVDIIPVGIPAASKPHTLPTKAAGRAKTPKAVTKFLLKTGDKTQIDALKGLLSSWKSTKELVKVTGWKSTTIHARFNALRKQNLIQSKTGPDGLMIYRLTA